MKVKDISTAIQRTINLTRFHISNHAPEILSGLGVIGVVSGFGLCVKASFKAKDIVDDEGLTKESVKKAASNYITPAMATATGIGAFMSSNKILKTRYLALGAAYTALDRSFRAYRRNVEDTLNTSLDTKFRYGGEELTIEEDSETRQVILREINADGFSDYARYFTRSSAPEQFDKDMSLNVLMIEQIEEYANLKLGKQGFLFLNDVYEMLGLSKTLAGQSVGWLLGNGDNYIVIRHPMVNRRTVNGVKPTLVVDFNVDGDIRLKRLEDRKEL